MKRQLEQIIDKRSNGILQDIDSIIEYLQDILPHGSGIDSDWSIEYKPSTKKVYAHNSYHVMDENGYYSGWYDFTVSYKLHDMNEHVPCKYCAETGLRHIDSILTARSMELTDNNRETVKNESWFKPCSFAYNCFECTFCHGKGYTLPNAFEFINLNLHGEGKYLERIISYGTRDYLEELLYNPEDIINWHNEQKAKSGV